MLVARHDDDDDTKDEPKGRITTAFTNLNKETTGKVCQKPRSRLEAVVDVNDDLF